METLFIFVKYYKEKCNHKDTIEENANEVFEL